MSTLTVRNIEPDLKDKLRLTAAAHGHSMEEEVRTILRRALSQPTDQLAKMNVWSYMRAQIEAAGGGVDLDLPDRKAYQPKPLSFD